MGILTFALVMFVLINHGFADFLLQNEKMATQKSKSNYWLSVHILVYTLGMIPTALIVWFFTQNIFYAVLWLIGNGALHWITDFCTSRWTSKLYANKQFYTPNKYIKFVNFPSFFGVIELDQVIHYTCLFGSLTALI
jgi:hypothetical protein